MIVNHTDNSALFCNAIDRSNCKPLMNKLHECFQLFKKVNDPETKDALYLAVSEAVELAEDNAFDRAAELQVAAQTDRQIVQPPLFAVDGHEVGQRLRGVIVAAVARVDDRDLRVHGRDQRRALLGMAHGDDVAVAADDAHGVRDGLALGGGRALRRGDAEHLAAEREHRALKARKTALRGSSRRTCGHIARGAP